jgi:excisionase family DNA binding protein
VKLLLTPEEAAELLGVGRTTLYDLIRTKELRSVQIGRLRRIKRTDLETYAEQL